MTIFLDIETRSAADLKEVGAHRYAVDPSTEILMMGVSELGADTPVYMWHKYEVDGLKSDAEVQDLIDRADEIYAHNAPFEQAVMAAQWPVAIPISKWRDTAAMARKAGLPWSLEKVAEALELPQKKDLIGKKLIKLFSIPNERSSFNNPSDFSDHYGNFCNYCRQDVITEKAVYEKLKDFALKGDSLATFQFDLRLNQVGIPLNRAALVNADKIINEVQKEQTKIFLDRTGINPTQRERVRLLFDLPDMQSETVENAIKNKHPNEELLQIYQSLSYAAIKKVKTMLDCLCPDDRVRGTLLYYGAGTGRWSGRLVQPQNFKKTPKELRSITHEVFKRIESGATAEELRLVYGEPLELIAAVIRQFISVTLDADYSAIEARLICWLAGQEDVLDMWRQGKDLYRWMAGHVYGIPMESVDSDQREVGKRIILGAGYGMGAAKFQSSCLEQYGLDLSTGLCEKGIQLYRTLCNKITKYWYKLEKDAREAIAKPNIQCGAFKYRSAAGIPYLLFTLRSGRQIAYPKPKIEIDVKTGRDNITYWGQVAGSTQWGRIKLYSGKFAENETQATAADIMAHGAIKAEEAGYEIVTLIHDQALAIKRDGQSALQFGNCLATLPSWATGLPLKVEAKECQYYSK